MTSQPLVGALLGNGVAKSARARSLRKFSDWYRRRRQLDGRPRPVDRGLAMRHERIVGPTTTVGHRNSPRKRVVVNRATWHEFLSDRSSQGNTGFATARRSNSQCCRTTSNAAVIEKSSSPSSGRVSGVACQ
jgi:hypothetical protein